MNKIITIKTKEDLKDLVENQIYETTNYDLFHFMTENREVKPAKVQKLVKAIQKKNLLKDVPIKINRKHDVYDGQKRLLAAKELLIPIYFTYHPNADSVDMQLLNINVDEWRTFDYLNHYIKLGKQDYIRLKEFANEYRISVPVAMQLLAGNEIQSKLGGSGEITATRDSFKEGTFSITNFENAERVASLITEVRKYSPDLAWRHLDCIRALVIFANNLDPKILTNALSKYQQIVTRRYAVVDYLKEFENIVSAGGKTINLTSLLKKN